jgi:polyisoprenoid-binding protein YceI
MLKYRNLALLGVTVIAVTFMKPLPLLGQKAAAQVFATQDSLAYALDSSSLLLVHAGKSGLLKGFGHEHQVRAHAFSGTLTYFPNDVGRSSVLITVLTNSLRVVPEADSADIPEITRTMREKTLRVDSFPEIAFVSRTVELVRTGGAAELMLVRVTGDLTMVGRTQPVSVDLTLEVSADTLRAEGEFVVKQTDFGIKPYSKALGLVKVKDEVRFELRVVAARGGAPVP